MKPTNKPNSESQSEPVLAKAKIILLGLDVHAESIMTVRQIDGATPQPGQRFGPAKFLSWAQEQTRKAEAVWTCYEAGPFGYGLHRKLEALGIHNLVVAPQSWEEQSGVKTDKKDALALCQRLALYVGGNRRAFTVVQAPTEAEEQVRGESRLRDQLRRNRQRFEAQGRSLLLTYGYRFPRRRWWMESTWVRIAVGLPPGLVELLDPLRECTLKIHGQVERLSQVIEA